MGSNCCKGDASRPLRSSSSIYSRSRAGASLDERFTSSEDAGGVRLTVSAAKAGDSAVYTLQATNSAGKDTARVRLEVSPDEAPTGDDPPTFLRRLQDLTVKVGTRTRFLVEIVSSTECKVTWYRNERRLMEAERVSLVRDGTFWCADIAAVSVDDTGRWTCTAENAGGRASCSAHLNVLVPKAYKRPEFVEELRALLTEQGTVSLECKVVGVPTPVLRWFKDSREIKAGDVFALTANAEDPTSLGTYTCEAVNCMGRAYSSSKVHVVGRSREGSARPISSGVTPESPPIFTKELEDKFVRICEHLTLSCHIVVPPWPRSVVWYNKEGKVEPGERYHVVEDGVGGYLLEVQSAEWPDEGEWKCVATSSGGRVGITSCYVSMEVPKNYRKPRFMENLQAVLTEEGLVSFECKVVGFPTPVLSWFKDGQELKPGDVYQLTGTNSLGSYCCIARNCMGQASSSAELTVEDIQNQLNEEEKAHLFSKNQAPKFIQGLKSVEAKIDEPFRFTIKVAIPPEPSVQWFRDEQPVDESTRCHLGREDRGGFYLDIQSLEFLDQAEWKCVALNDYGHSVTSCFLKLIIPRHYKKPRFLENLQAILSEEGAVNLECKVIGVPQPVLKWYKDGEELKPGDIHRIISGQDGTCCLGTYTCEAQNCMGIAASSASLLGFDDSMKAKAKKKTEEQALQRNLSLSTIHEERTSQMYDTPVGDITLDDKGEISFSFDGKEVSVSLYETPDLTEEEALQIVEMYADQLSENVTEHNVVELPPLRFVKETSTSGNLLMEAIIIDVSPEYFASPEEDLRTEADVEDISIADEMGPPQLSLDQDVGGADYLEKTMALLSDEKADIPKKMPRKKSDSQRSVDDFYSLSMDPSLSEDKKDDDTQNISESFASAKSLGKPKSKSSKPSAEDGQESSDVTKTILYKDESQKQVEPATVETPVTKPKRERRSSRSSRRSSSGSEKSYNKSKEELVETQGTVDPAPPKPSLTDEEFKSKMVSISTSLSKVINDVQVIERDIILKSELMSSAATASRSLEIISSLIKPLSEIHSITDAAKESALESRDVSSTLFSNLPQPLKVLQQSLTIIEKCIDVESDNKTLVKKTCVAFIETCGEEVKNLMNEITTITDKNYLTTEQKILTDICSLISDMHNVIKFSEDTIKTRNLLSEASEIKSEETTVETKHLRDTQKAIFELKSPLNSLLCIVDTADSGKVVDVNKVTSSEVILNDMSASIQDLQAALEHIESLSVKESTTSLYKYNTGIIETVMDSALKLRSSFEQLPTESKNEEDERLLKQALVSIKNNLGEISSHIETIEKNVGSFDILQSDNKLEVLQKMAQILILLENNLPRLESMPEVKTHMDVFHKNLTRILENVIESNEAQKYFTLMEICDAVNRLNASLKNMETDNVLALASLSNTMRIIQDTFIKHVFESELNCSILTNITEVLLSIQEALNHAEEISLQLESERVQDISCPIYNSSKANVVVEHIDHTIAVINTIRSIETTKELQSFITPALENICPVLEELKRNIASAKPADVPEDEHISEMSDASFVKTLATPLLELNNNLLVLNQVIVDNLESLKENTEVVSAIAEPLHELHTTLQILQQDVVSQYGEDVAPYEVSINIVSAVHNLQSCMVMIQEQPGVEGVDDMSTLEDISGIKTTAETIPSDRLVLPTADEIAIEHSVAFLEQEIAPSATAQALQTLNQHIIVLQNPEIVDALDTLSEVSDYSSLKSVALGLGELHTGIEEILHPFVMENSSDIANLINTSKLAAIAEPMQELQQSLSVLDTSNIPIYEHILEIPSEKIHSVLHSISDFKQYLGKCIQALFPAMETADRTIEISNKVEALREVCEHLKEIIVTTKAISKETPMKQEVITLEETVNSLLDATDVSKGIQIQIVKNITEELFEKVVTVQEELIQFTPHTAEKLTEEAKLIQAIDDIENNIAVLEQYDFVDLSRVSEITSCATPQLAIELESEPLVQMDDILQNAVNVLQDSAKETPLADLMILEDFFKTCKSEFTIIRLIISKSLSHKKIIRLIQEFSFLQNIIKDFKLKRLDLQLSDDIDGYLKIFFIEADGNLKTIQQSLLKLVDSQSELLFAIPMNILQNANESLNEIGANNENLKDVVPKLIDIIEVAKPVLQNIKVEIQEELKYPTSQPVKTDSKEIIDKMEDLLKYTEDRIASPSLKKHNKKIILNLISCLQKHQDCKDATGTGKHLIILKCLSECVQILNAGVAEAETSKKAKGILEDNALKAVLSEMIEPLHALHSQLINIQEQVTSGFEEKSVSVDITTTESMIEAVSEIHREIVQQIESAKSTVDDEDISLMMEADKQIHAIQDSLKSLENIPAVQELQEIAKPINEVEKSLHSLISSEIIEAPSAESLPKEKATELLLSINQFIELTEIVAELTEVVKIDKLKESVNIARELRDSIVLSGSEIATEDIQIAQKLQVAISAINIQVLDNTRELSSQLNPELIERFTNISEHLQDNLATVTGVQTTIEAPTELKSKKVKADLSKEKFVKTISIESATVAEITKPVVLEQVVEINCQKDKKDIAIESIIGESETKEIAASEGRMELKDAALASSVAEKKTVAVIESSVPFVNKEVEQMKPQEIAESKLESSVDDKSKLEVASIDEKHVMKDTKLDLTDGVKQCIENLLSADVTETLENLTTVLDTEKLKQTVNIAKELRDNLALIENTTQEKSNETLVAEQVDLVEQLQNALLTVQEQIFENYQQVEKVCDTNKLQKVSEITVNLQSNLSAVVSTPQEIKEEKLTEAEKSSIPCTVVSELVTFEESKLVKADDVADQQIAQSMLESEAIAMGISTEVIPQEDQDLAKEKPTMQSTPVQAEESIKPEVEEKAVSEATVAISDETMVPPETTMVGFEVAEKEFKVAQEPVSAETKSVALKSAIVTKTSTMEEVQPIKITETELAKANLETLIHNIETFVSGDISQILHNISDLVSLDVLKQSVHVSNELRKNIAALQISVGKEETVNFDTTETDACVQQVNFARQLQNALIVLQNVLHEKETELLPILGDDKLQRVKEIVSELVGNLRSILVTSQPMLIQQAPLLFKSDNVEDQINTESVVLSSDKELCPAPQLLDESKTPSEKENVPTDLLVETVKEAFSAISINTELSSATIKLEPPETDTFNKIESKQLESIVSESQNTIATHELGNSPVAYEQSKMANLETTKQSASNEQNNNLCDALADEQAIPTNVNAEFETANIEKRNDIVDQDAIVLNNVLNTEQTTSQAAREPQEIPVEEVTISIENMSSTDIIKQQVADFNKPAVAQPKTSEIIESKSDITVIETSETEQKSDAVVIADQVIGQNESEKRFDSEEVLQLKAIVSVIALATEIKEPMIVEQQQVFEETTPNKVIEIGLENTDPILSQKDLLQSVIVSGVEDLGLPYAEEETIFHENVNFLDTVGIHKQTCDVNVVQQKSILGVTQPISSSVFEGKSVAKSDKEVSAEVSTVEPPANQFVEIAEISSTDPVMTELEEDKNKLNITEQEIELDNSRSKSVTEERKGTEKLETYLEEENAAIKIQSEADQTASRDTSQDKTVFISEQINEAALQKTKAEYTESKSSVSEEIMEITYFENVDNFNIPEQNANSNTEISEAVVVGEPTVWEETSSASPGAFMEKTLTEKLVEDTTDNVRIASEANEFTVQEQAGEIALQYFKNIVLVEEKPIEEISESTEINQIAVIEPLVTCDSINIATKKAVDELQGVENKEKLEHIEVPTTTSFEKNTPVVALTVSTGEDAETRSFDECVADDFVVAEQQKDTSANQEFSFAENMSGKVKDGFIEEKADKCLSFKLETSDGNLAEMVKETHTMQLETKLQDKIIKTEEKIENPSEEASLALLNEVFLQDHQVFSSDAITDSVVPEMHHDRVMTPFATDFINELVIEAEARCINILGSQLLLQGIDNLGFVEEQPPKTNDLFDLSEKVDMQNAECAIDENLFISDLQRLEDENTANIFYDNLSTVGGNCDSTEATMEEQNDKIMEVESNQNFQEIEYPVIETSLLKCVYSDREISVDKLKSGELLQHIDVLISEEMAEAIDELATVTDSAALKNTVELAKELRDCLILGSQDIILEDATPLVQDTPLQQGELKDKLNEALTNIQTTLLDSTQDATLLSPEKLERISKAVTHVMEDLKLASVSEIQALETEFTESTKEESMKQLECLLQEVTDKIDLSSSDRVPEDTEALRDSLDEVQTVIIKLKRDFDGANDTLNETLEDLECSVRSVQLQINEDSPPDLLKEACATLQLLVNNMSETNETCVSEVVVKEMNLKDIFEKCSNETSETVQLLEKASNIDTKVKSKLGDIVSNLNTLTESMKSLKSSFVGNAETLIEKGIDIIQSLDQIEEKVFSIEKELDSAYALPTAVRDNIVTAVHSVYGSISNMRSTILTAQKQYIFENYGKPSENLIHSIKNVSSLANSSNDELEKAKMKKFSKSLRNVLNHFEDIKFYINLDKTARLPSDAAFTKAILEELKCNVQVLTTIMEFDNILKNKISNTLKCIENSLHGIEQRSTLEVKEKIPIFKDIASKLLDVTSNLKVAIENRPFVSSDKDLLIKSETEMEQEEVTEVTRDHITESSDAGTATQMQISEEMAIAVETPKGPIEMGVAFSQAEEKVETTQSLDEIALALDSDQVQEELSKAQTFEVQATKQITDIVEITAEAATAVLQESSISVDDEQKAATENVDEKHISESIHQLPIQESEKEEFVVSKMHKIEIDEVAGPSTLPDTVKQSSVITPSETEEAKPSNVLYSMESENQIVKESCEASQEKTLGETKTDGQKQSTVETQPSLSEQIELSEEVQKQEKDQQSVTRHDQKDVQSIKTSTVQDEQLTVDEESEKQLISQDKSSGTSEITESEKLLECKPSKLEEKANEIKPGTSNEGRKHTKDDKVTIEEDQTQKAIMLVQVGTDEQNKTIEEDQKETSKPQNEKKLEPKQNTELEENKQAEVLKTKKQVIEKTEDLEKQRQEVELKQQAENLQPQSLNLKKEDENQKQNENVDEQKEKGLKEVEDFTKEQQKKTDKMELEKEKQQKQKELKEKQKDFSNVKKQETEASKQKDEQKQQEFTKKQEEEQKQEDFVEKQKEELKHDTGAEMIRIEEEQKLQQEEFEQKELVENQKEESKPREQEDSEEKLILEQQKDSTLLRHDEESRQKEVEKLMQKELQEKQKEEEKQLQLKKEQETKEKLIKKQQKDAENLRKEEKKQKELFVEEEQKKQDLEMKQREEEISLKEQENETKRLRVEEEKIQQEKDIAKKQKEEEIESKKQENETERLRVEEEKNKKKRLAKKQKEEEINLKEQENETERSRVEEEKNQKEKGLAGKQKEEKLQIEIELDETRVKDQQEEKERVQTEEKKKQEKEKSQKEQELEKKRIKENKDRVKAEEKKNQEEEGPKQPQEELELKQNEEFKMKELENDTERLRVEEEKKQLEKKLADKQKEKDLKLEHQRQEELKQREQETEAEILRVDEEKKIIRKEAERKQKEIEKHKEEEQKIEKELEEKRIKEQQDEAEWMRVEEEQKQQELLNKEEEERRLKEQEETDLKLQKEEQLRREKEIKENKQKELAEKQKEDELKLKKQNELGEQKRQQELLKKEEERKKKDQELQDLKLKEQEIERLRLEEEKKQQEIEEENRMQKELAVKQEYELNKQKEQEEKRIKEEKEAEKLRIEAEKKQQELLKKEEEERKKKELAKKKKDKELKLKQEKEMEEKRIKEQQEEAERLRVEEEKEQKAKEEAELKQKELLEKEKEEKLKTEKQLEEKRIQEQEEERLRLEAEKKQKEELRLKEEESKRLKIENEKKQQEEEERKKKEIDVKQKEELKLKERQKEEEILRLEAQKKLKEEQLKLQEQEKETETLKIEKVKKQQVEKDCKKKEEEDKLKQELQLKEQQQKEERIRLEAEKKQKAEVIKPKGQEKEAERLRIEKDKKHQEEETRKKIELEEKQKEELKLKGQQDKAEKLRLEEEKKQEILKKEEEERNLIELEKKNKENELKLKKEKELEDKRIKEQQEEAKRLKHEEESQEILKRQQEEHTQKQLAEKQKEEVLKRKEEELKEKELKLQKEKELKENRVKEQQEKAEKLRIEEEKKRQDFKKDDEYKEKELSEKQENEPKKKNEKELEDKRIKEEQDQERIQKEKEEATKLKQKLQKEEEAAELKKKEEQRLVEEEAEKEKKRLEEEKRRQNDFAMQKVKEEAEKLKKEKTEKKRLKKSKEDKAIAAKEKKSNKSVEDKQELEKQSENKKLEEEKMVVETIEVASQNGALNKQEKLSEDLGKAKPMTKDDGDDIKPDDIKKRLKKKEDLLEKSDDKSFLREKQIESSRTGQSIPEISPIKILDEKMIRKDLHEEKGSSKLSNDTRTDDRTKSYATCDTSQNSFKEYHYEPTARPKHDDREKPRFIDHNHRDYTMEFARPSAYREKTIEVENISFEKNTGRGHIYKANNLMMDAQLRASAPPRAVAPESSRRSEPEERRSDAKHRSKALSEARSLISEKRTGASRDIKRKPVFSTFLTDRTAVEGSRVKLTCSVLSSSDPTVTWYKNGVLLDNKLKYRTKMTDGLITLEVLNAVPSDSAEYSCTVENENGSISTSANLKVYPSFEASPIPPTFTRSIRDTYHLLENELVLECRIRGQPLPSITWLKDDRPVSMNERFQAYYLADGVCRLAISSPTPEDSGKYTCKAENSVWSDQITHIVNYTGKESRLSPNLATIERLHAFNRQSQETRRPHFGNVLTDYKVTTGGTIGLQVEIKGSPTRVEWLREGHSVMETYSNARTYVEQGLYTLALSDVTEKESGMYTCRAWSNHGTVDMNAAITVVQPNEMEGRPAIIVGRPEKDVLISVGEDLNISFRVQGEPKPKVIFMKGIRDITNSQRVCKMTSDDYVKFTVKRSVISDAGTYCILARNAYGCDRAFVTVVVRQRASSENLISDWTYPLDDSALSITERNFKSLPDRIPGEPSVVDGGSNWLSIAWPKPDPTDAAPVLAYKVESWLAGKEGGARWTELGITPLNSFDAFNLKQGEEYHFRVTPRNRYGWGESVQTSSPIGVGLAGDRPEFVDILPGQLKVLIGETANLSCSVRGKPTPEVVWMKNGHEVEDEDARVTTSFNGFNCSLVIKGISPEDEARYSCEATNVHGRASTYARLAVVTDRLIWEADAKLKRERSSDASGEYPPQFTMRLRDRRVQATYPVRLTCQVVGSPPPSVTWFKDGEEVEFDKRHTKSQDEHFHTLEIAPTTLEDGGVYEVMARNSCGAISCHCNLVVDKGIRAYVAPEFCCGLEPLYRLKEGEELRISAVVEAYPTVGVTWYRDGVRLRPSRRAIMTLDRDGQIELALAFVTPRDAGVYTCTASNEVGRATTSGKVEVIGDATVVKKKTPPMLISPDVPYSKEPMFIRKPRSSEAREGDTVIIQCEVVGDPKPDVYWLRDFLKPDYYRDATHFKRVGNGPEYRFEIPHAKLDYTGAYSVVARNVHGEAKAIISLQILAKDPSSTEEHNVRYGRVDVIPRFERNLTDLLCYDGDAIEFECHVSGHPEPDIRWFHYTELIRENPDFEWSLEDGTARLKIKQVTAEDEGTYLCEASNSLGKATSSACLVVYPPGEPNTLSQRLRRPPALLSAASTPRSTPRSTPARSVSRTPGPDPRRLCSPSRQMPPKFYTYPFNKVVEEGETVVFQCAVKGLPAPWATWDKDGVIITPSARITIKEKDEILRILEIEEVTIEDVGVYRITLENDLGRVEASARLEVITQKGKFYAGVRSYSPSPRKSLTYRRRPSRQD